MFWASRPGLTTLTLLDATGQLITNVDVRVASDVTEFKERLRQILPGEKIEVRTANDGIVLSGTVSSYASACSARLIWPNAMHRNGCRT